MTNHNDGGDRGYQKLTNTRIFCFITCEVNLTIHIIMVEVLFEVIDNTHTEHEKKFFFVLYKFSFVL